MYADLLVCQPCKSRYKGEAQAVRDPPPGFGAARIALLQGGPWASCLACSFGRVGVVHGVWHPVCASWALTVVMPPANDPNQVLIR
jgi:hypothetical protein